MRPRVRVQATPTPSHPSSSLPLASPPLLRAAPSVVLPPPAPQPPIRPTRGRPKHTRADHLQVIENSKKQIKELKSKVAELKKENKLQKNKIESLGNIESLVKERGFFKGPDGKQEAASSSDT